MYTLVEGTLLQFITTECTTFNFSFLVAVAHVARVLRG